MSKTELETLLESSILAGESHQAVYDKFAPQHPGMERQMAEIMSMIPSVEKRELTKALPWVIVGLVGVSFAFKVAFGISLFSANPPISLAYGLCLVPTLVSILPLWGLFRWNPNSCTYLSYACLFDLLIHLLVVLILDVNHLWSVAPLVVAVSLSHYLSDELITPFKADFRQEQHPNGQVLIRHEIRFITQNNTL
jgi:hypothetical protein